MGLLHGGSYAIILSSWDEIQQGTVSLNISAEVDGVRVAPFVVGDSAFPLEKGIMKPYINSTLSSEQRYFNNR